VRHQQTDFISGGKGEDRPSSHKAAGVEQGKERWRGLIFGERRKKKKKESERGKISPLRRKAEESAILTEDSEGKRTAPPVREGKVRGKKGRRKLSYLQQSRLKRSPKGPKELGRKKT